MTSLIAEEAVRVQIDRLVRSEVLRNSETLQRLLRYLTEKSLSGGADPLKEYAIGMDVFAKGADYDPRQDSGVRIHVGRLRQKLAEYYASEGANDPVTVTLPKGHFKLVFEERAIAPDSRSDSNSLDEPAGPDGPIAEPVLAPASFLPVTPTRWRTAVLLLAAALLVALVWAAWSSIALRRVSQEQAVDAAWTIAQQEFWSPFVGPDRPLLIVIRTPLFASLRRDGVYRERFMNKWNELLDTPHLKSIRQALGDPPASPLYSYAGFGEAKSAALLGIMLARHTQSIHLVRSSDVSWQEIAEGNAIFLGRSTAISELLESLPVLAQINLEPKGIRVLSPKTGASTFIGDEMVGDSASGYSSFTPDDGVANAVISILPGPNGKSTVANFAANLNAGLLAAVEFVMDPTRLEQLNEKLREESGHIPQYFQVALQVTFKGGVPVSSRYLLHREVRMDSRGLP
jgi:hypothetical protein